MFLRYVTHFLLPSCWEHFGHEKTLPDGVLYYLLHGKLPNVDIYASNQWTLVACLLLTCLLIVYLSAGFQSHFSGVFPTNLIKSNSVCRLELESWLNSYSVFSKNLIVALLLAYLEIFLSKSVSRLVKCRLRRGPVVIVSLGTYPDNREHYTLLRKSVQLLFCPTFVTYSKLNLFHGQCM